MRSLQIISSVPKNFLFEGQYSGHPMQQRTNPTPPGPQGPPPGQGPPVRPQNSDNLHALQKAIDTMEEKGKKT